MSRPTEATQVQINKAKELAKKYNDAIYIGLEGNHDIGYSFHFVKESNVDDGYDAMMDDTLAMVYPDGEVI